MYLELLVVKLVKGVPSTELFRLQWKTNLLGLETTLHGSSTVSKSATPTICGSSKPQYGESKKREFMKTRGHWGCTFLFLGHEWLIMSAAWEFSKNEWEKSYIKRSIRPRSGKQIQEVISRAKDGEK